MRYFLGIMGIIGFVRYFLGIVGIIGFCDFVIFPSRHNSLILQFCTQYSNTSILYFVFRIVKDFISSMYVSMISQTTLKFSCTFMLISFL